VLGGAQRSPRDAIPLQIWKNRIIT
jgi:hypothetical protein